MLIGCGGVNVTELYFDAFPLAEQTTNGHVNQIGVRIAFAD